VLQRRLEERGCELTLHRERLRIGLGSIRLALEDVPRSA
jgi:hypothetical protein